MKKRERLYMQRKKLGIVYYLMLYVKAMTKLAKAFQRLSKPVRKLNKDSGPLAIVGDDKISEVFIKQNPG